MPRRIQRSRKRGWSMLPGAVYVGRPGVFGNPFRCTDPEIATAAHAAWLAGNDAALDFVLANATRVVTYGEATTGLRYRALRAIDSLRGLDLVCWCSPDHACHADNLLLLAANPDRVAELIQSARLVTSPASAARVGTAGVSLSAVPTVSPPQVVTRHDPTMQEQPR